jgi:hypothetical protein
MARPAESVEMTTVNQKYDFLFAKTEICAICWLRAGSIRGSRDAGREEGSGMTDTAEHVRRFAHKLRRESGILYFVRP